MVELWNSTITAGNDFTIAVVSGLFNKGTSTVVLAGTGNITNADSLNAFYNLKQNHLN